MSDNRDDALQFDSVVPPPLPVGAAAAPTDVICAACQAMIEDEDGQH